MTSPLGQLEGYALWLIPSQSDLTAWEKLQQRSCRFFDTETFSIHLSLLGRLNSDDPTQLAHCMHILAEETRPLDLAIRSIGFRQDYFRAFYVLLETHAELQSVRERALHRFRVKDKPYMPHISLAYGAFAESLKREFQPVIEPDIPDRVRLDQLQLVHLNGYPQQWQTISHRYLQAE